MELKLCSKIAALQILIVILGIVGCQQVTQETIYLQENERYLLKLDDYYDFAAGSFDFPLTLSPEQIQSPLVYFKDQQTEGYEYETLCSFQNTDDSKYFLGFGFDFENEQILIIYSYLQLISGIPKRTELANLPIGSSKEKDRHFKACFYNSVSGFIKSNINNIAKIFQFTYNNQQLVTKELPYFPFDEFVAVQFNENLIYLICAQKSDNSVSLLLYNAYSNNLSLVDQFRFQSKSIQIQVDFATSGTLLVKDQNNTIYIFSINFQSQKLKANTISGLKNGQLNSIQRFKDYYFITLTKQSSTVFYKIKWKKIGSEGGLTILKTGLINQAVNKSILIDDDILIFDDLKKMPFMYTFIYNIQKRQSIYQFEGMINDVYKFIKNVTIKVNMAEKTLVWKFTPFRVQTPSIQLIGEQNQILDLTVYQHQKQYNKKIVFVVSISNSCHLQIKNNPISILLQQSNNSKNYVSIGDLIQGSNLQADSDISDNKIFKSIALTQTSVMSKNEQLSIQNIQAEYKTDGLFSSIIVQSMNESSYKIYAIAPFANYTADFGKVLTYESQEIFNFPIEKIDNQGAFTLKDSSDIYIPIVIGQTLSFSKITINCFDFQFASDLSYGVIFIKCQKEITQYNYEIIQSTLQFIKQNVLIFDASAYQSMICINGHLYINNDQSIVAYNYLLGFFAQNVIQIPQLSVNNQQQVILFSSTFFIIVQNGEQQLVVQYSYQEFISNIPSFLRTLTNIPAIILSFVAIREEIEYLILKENQSLFYLYKVKDVCSQNQFYSKFDLNQGYSNPIKTIFNSEAFCIIYPITKCSMIFSENSLEYELIPQQAFQKELKIQSQIQLKFENEQDLQINIEIIRDASTKNGQVDQNSEQIQKLRTLLQDEQINIGSTFYFNDQQVFNSCLLGWQLLDSSYATIFNRIQPKINQLEYNVFTILYGLKATLMKDKLIYGNNQLVLQKNFSEYEILLYDSASYKQKENETFSVNVYLIGQQNMQVQNVQLSLSSDGLTNKIKILDSQIFQYEIDNSAANPYNLIKLFDYQKIITIDEQLWIINSKTNNAYQLKITKNEQILKSSTNYPPAHINVISYNVINQLQLQLTFYSSGIVNVKHFGDTSNIKYSYQNLKRLLSQFEVKQTDLILRVNQYSDNKFWIQFANSFIFDVTMTLSQNQELVLSSINAYYYKDSFQLLQTGFKGKKYTLLFSESSDMTVTLYSINIYQNTSYHLIQSQQKILDIYPNIQNAQIIHIEQETQDKIIVYCLDKRQIVIQVSDEIGINLPYGRGKYDFQLKITPIESNNINNLISLQVSSEGKNFSEVMNNFIILIYLMVQIILL
ncbi:hypothetical protein ABPG74_020407 [Tetrahymena malaccensis]